MQKKQSLNISQIWKKIRANTLLAWTMDIVFFAVILLLIYNWQTRHLITADGTQSVPQFQAQTLDGALISSEQLREKKHLLYFFATWCGVCNMSMSNLTSLRDAVDESELGIYLVALNYQNRQELEEYVREHDLNIPVILGTPRISNDFNIESFPTYYILNESGKIVSRDVGYSTKTGMMWRSGNLGM